MILSQLKDSIFTITLNRPKEANAWTSQMIDDFVHTLQEADFSKDVKAILITGAGKHFCAGGDIKDMRKKQGMFEGDSSELMQKYHQGIQRIPRLFESLQTPVIAAVNGAAIGAGLDLACMCDIRVAANEAKFGQTFNNLGLVPGDGGSFFLQRVIGFPKAMELGLTGEIIDAPKAKDYGLVNYIGDDFKDYAYSICKKIAKQSATSTQMTKRAIINARNSSLDSHLNLLSAYQGITQRTKDHFDALDKLLNNNSR